MDSDAAAFHDLAAAHVAWSMTSKAERAAVAKEVLVALSEDRWSVAGDWVGEELELQRVSKEPGVGAASRFVFGSLVKDFCSSIIAAAEGKELKQLPAASDGSRRFEVPLGLAAPGFCAELWAGALAVGEAPTTASALRPSAAEAAWRGSAACAPGTATLVLAAGNQGFLSLVEVLGRVLQHGDTVLIKHHPLRPFMMAPYATLLAPLMARGLVAQTLDAGVPATAALLAHPRLGHVSLIGSEATAAAVRKRLDAAGRTEVGLSAELGCVTPVLLAGGQWEQRELEHAATCIAAAKKANGGCNCLAPQVVLLPRGWAQADDFRAALAQQLRRQPTMPAYYPGSSERRAAIAQRYGDQARSVGAGAPRQGRAADEDETLLVECGAAAAKAFDGDVLQREAFGAALALVEVGATDGAAAGASYLSSVAVPFANSEACAGCLSCSLFAPASAAAAEVERALAGLRYGCVALNGWSVLGYMAACKGASWGAHPDGGPRSGCGISGNGYGHTGVLKTVVRGPPLSTSPLFGGPVPPALVFDALHAAASAPSAARALLRVWLVLTGRLAQNALVKVGVLGAPRRMLGAAA